MLKNDWTNHETEISLPKGENRKEIGLMKNELGTKIMTKFVGLRQKTFSYLIDGGSGNKNTKGTKKQIINLRFSGLKAIKLFIK